MFWWNSPVVRHHSHERPLHAARAVTGVDEVACRRCTHNMKQAGCRGSHSVCGSIGVPLSRKIHVCATVRDFVVPDCIGLPSSGPAALTKSVFSTIVSLANTSKTSRPASKSVIRLFILVGCGSTLSDRYAAEVAVGDGLTACCPLVCSCPRVCCSWAGVGPP